jgi:hypothetical protein
VEKKKCTKIDPCYIVLTNIEQAMQTKVSISSRAFKRSFVECSNMCKKIMFKRRLKAGKDVFDVKTPSKQKDYLLYLMKVEEERFKKNKKNTVQCTKIQDIIEKHDLKIAARKIAFGKKVHPRVRRTISKLPKDFADRPVSPLQDSINANEKDYTTEELEKLQEAFVKKKHKVELNSLKRLIGIKRSLNQNLKKSKRLRPEGYESFLKSDVTSNVSGRVRKVNPKYGVDYAMSRKDFEEQRVFEVAQSQLKRAETESKRKQEEISFDFLLQKRRKVSMASNKKVKQPMVQIENAENDDVIKTTVNSKKSKMSSKKINMKTTALQSLLESPLVSGMHANQHKSSGNVKNAKQKRSKNVDKDAVLIQDLPKEEKLISGFLQETVKPSTQKEFVTEQCMASEVKDGDQYVRARQLLRDSLDRNMYKARIKIKQTVVPKQETLYSNAQTSQQAIVQEKYKVLKIPETVQKLFDNTKIKQEPPDDGYGTSSSSSTVSSSAVNTTKVVTVAYSNGVYKKVLMSVPSTTTVTSYTTKASNVASTPILVNTNNGQLHYFVPNQMYSKLPTYSDAIKAKFLPPKSDTSSISTIASPSSVSGGVPTVLQIPFNKPMSPTVIVSQPYVNKSYIHTVKAVKSPTCATSVQTHTVVHKVSPSPAVQNKLEQNSTTSIQQQSVPFKSTPSTTSPQKIEKCKFYLLKIDGKNVLIPIEGNQAQPKAFVVNSDIITSSVQSNNLDSTATTGNVGQLQKTDGIRPTLLGGSNSDVQSQKKPTLAVVPNVKPGNLVLPTQMTLISNTKNISENKSQLQTVTLTNVGAVSKTGIANSGKLSGTNITIKNTNLAGSANTLKGVTPILSVANNVVGNTAIKSDMKTAFTNVVSSGSYKLAPKPVISHPVLRNTDITKSSPLTVLPVYLKPMDSSVPGILQLQTVPVNLKNAMSAMGNQFVSQPDSKTKTLHSVTNMQGVHAIQKPVSPFKNPSVIKQGQSNTVRSQLETRRETKTLQGRTESLGGVSLLKSVSTSPSVATQGQTINNKDKHGEMSVKDFKAIQLCEKSGAFVSEEACNSTTEQATVDTTEPLPFKEAVTAREERLRRLKELLKEKQKAVEEIRTNVPK